MHLIPLLGIFAVWCRKVSCWAGIIFINLDGSPLGVVVWHLLSLQLFLLRDSLMWSSHLQMLPIVVVKVYIVVVVWGWGFGTWCDAPMSDSLTVHIVSIISGVRWHWSFSAFTTTLECAQMLVVTALLGFDECKGLGLFFVFWCSCSCEQGDLLLRWSCFTRYEVHSCLHEMFLLFNSTNL